MKLIKQVDTAIEKFVSMVLIVDVFALLIFSVLSIVLRWMNTSIHWIEPLVRHLVFLSAFFGGVLATGRGTHIGIDIVSKFFEAKKDFASRKIVKLIVALTSFLALLWLVKASYDFMKVELEYGKEVFWGIQSGVLVGIIPFGFSLMALRYFAQLFLIMNHSEEVHANA